MTTTTIPETTNTVEQTDDSTESQQVSYTYLGDYESVDQHKVIQI